MKKLLTIIVTGITVPWLTACQTTKPSSVTIAPDQMLTVGKVQKEIRKGMSSSEVVEALGTPNLVTTDAEQCEIWVYDRFATEARTSNSSKGLWLLIIGGSTHSQTKAVNQRNLTVIVKFDHKGLVKDFSYRASTF